ncbi:ABC transporter permease subunit [Saccharopolyspora shandongensis]|uniref:ABC transporter permease n=1 Tax=Saccharopolyspora shandongensis TaxID=418495 RepID=UPI0034087683
MSAFDWLVDNAAIIGEYAAWHIYLSLVPLIAGLLLALPLGWLAHRYRSAYGPMVTSAGLLYTLPSLALFILLPQVLGTRMLDPLNIISALLVYTVALLVRVVADALAAVPSETALSAEAMGYRPLQRFCLVELPIAVPVIAAGLRVAAASNVSLVSLASLLGIPQLGSLFTTGFQLDYVVPIIAGIVGCVVVAWLFDALILLVSHRLTPWRKAGSAT